MRLPAKGYDGVEFDLPPHRLAALLAAGRNAVAGYFDRPQPSAAGIEGMQGEPTPSSAVIDRRANEILAQ